MHQQPPQQQQQQAVYHQQAMGYGGRGGPAPVAAPYGGRGGMVGGAPPVGYGRGMMGGGGFGGVVPPHHQAAARGRGMGFGGNFMAGAGPGHMARQGPPNNIQMIVLVSGLPEAALIAKTGYMFIPPMNHSLAAFLEQTIRIGSHVVCFLQGPDGVFVGRVTIASSARARTDIPQHLRDSVANLPAQWTHIARVSHGLVLPEAAVQWMPVYRPPETGGFPREQEAVGSFGRIIPRHHAIVVYHLLSNVVAEMKAFDSLHGGGRKGDGAADNAAAQAAGNDQTGDNPYADMEQPGEGMQPRHNPSGSGPAAGAVSPFLGCFDEALWSADPIHTGSTDVPVDERTAPPMPDQIGEVLTVERFVDALRDHAGILVILRALKVFGIPAANVLCDSFRKVPETFLSVVRFSPGNMVIATLLTMSQSLSYPNIGLLDLWLAYSAKASYDIGSSNLITTLVSMLNGNDFIDTVVNSVASSNEMDNMSTDVHASRVMQSLVSRCVSVVVNQPGNAAAATTGPHANVVARLVQSFPYIAMNSQGNYVASNFVACAAELAGYNLEPSNKLGTARRQPPASEAVRKQANALLMSIARVIGPVILQLSSNKFGSNVMEKLAAAAPITEHMCSAILIDQTIPCRMASDPFANYVLRRVLDNMPAAKIPDFIAALEPYEQALRSNQYAKGVMYWFSRNRVPGGATQGNMMYGGGGMHPQQHMQQAGGQGNAPVQHGGFHMAHGQQQQHMAHGQQHGAPGGFGGQQQQMQQQQQQHNAFQQYPQY